MEGYVMSGNSVIEKQNSKEKGKNSEEVGKNSSYGKRGMYSSITIENFRLFDHLELDDLARVNLFFGPNNSGKTSILEAVFTHACGLNFGPFRSQVVVNRRGGRTIEQLELGELFMLVFRDRSSLPYKCTISAKLVGNPLAHTVTLTFHPSSELSDLDPRTFGQFSEIPPSGYLPQFTAGKIQIIDDQIAVQPAQIQATFLGKWKTQFDGEEFEFDLDFPPSSVPAALHFKLGYMQDPLSHKKDPKSEGKIFSHLRRYEILDEFTEEMGVAFPGVRKIDKIDYPDGTLGPVYVWMGDQPLPLYLSGDGMRRWFHLLGRMLVYRDAVHCIDEIDAFFHPYARHHLSRLLVQYAEKFENQLFLTSHSMEFADAFLETLYGEDGMFASSSEDPVRVFTIKPSEDRKSLDIWKLTGREAYKNRSYYELELR
jgi:hypothetical protein